MELTPKQAFVAAYLFLRGYFYRDDEPEYLRILLTDMMMTGHEKTLDPAVWQRWIEAVAQALEDDTLAEFK